MRKLLLIAMGALLLTACHHDDNKVKGKYSRTVLVYMAGDNNLTLNSARIDFAAQDLSEMIQGSKQVAGDCKLLLFVDKNIKNTTKQKPYLMLVENGDTTRLKTFDSELNSGDPATLRMAMKWAIDNYEAESYGLVLWGHADGWIIRNQAPAFSRNTRAYGVDNTSGVKWMDIPQMAQVLATLPKLDFIFADCCAFLCVESAYELRQCTDYIISSAAEIPGVGAPYQTVIPALFSQSSTFYQTVADAYFAQTSQGYKEPIAVVKTSEMENLAQATRTVLGTFVPQMENGGRRPDISGLIYYFDHTQFDMNDFILRYASENEYAQWKSVFNRAVVYSKMAPVWLANHIYYKSAINENEFRDFTVTEERYGGLGMYIPQDAASIKGYKNITFSIDKLNENIRLMQWYKAAGLDQLGW
ncbi:MAG: hypothetical protein IKR50_08425 [Prevotella sp.]|nr:hypothetical protein [Prevotella sp.]